MDEVVNSVIIFDKAYCRKERNALYADWTIAFWRELFQNSVDAGATKIAIELREAGGRGALGTVRDEPLAVTNVVFSDNGTGMSGEVISDIYFKMGMSTKDASDGTTIGGFGRARIMTCFSQERYSILTRDRFVMGDGPVFSHGSIGKQIENLREYASRIEGFEGEQAKLSLDGIRADIALLEETAKRRKGFQGCRVEVDLDHTPSRWADGGTVANMSKTLRRYIAESQLACEVTVNGQTPEAFFGSDVKVMARKGKAKSTLTFEAPEGGTVAFATVHETEGSKAAFPGYAIVRVAGASMYREAVTGLKSQVIIEIDPAQSRDALNANRDGMKGPYARVMREKLTELSVDTLSALKDKSAKAFEIEGEKGKITTSPMDLKAAAKVKFSKKEVAEVTRDYVKAPKIGSVEALKAFDVPQDVLNEFAEAAWLGDTFVEEYVREQRYAFDRDDEELFTQLEQAKQALYDEKRDAAWIVTNVAEKAKAWIMTGLQKSTAVEREKLREEVDRRIKGVHDIHIVMETTNAKTRAAAKRHHPENWDVAKGTGKAPRQLLAAWTAACGASIEAFYRVRPGRPASSWTTGFLYSLPQRQAQGDAWRDVATLAGCVPVGEGDYRFLLNPVNDDGTFRYSLSNERDLRTILVLAFHEIAHMQETLHDETFSLVNRDITAEVDWNAALKRMKAEMAAVTAAYSEGRARVQALDNEGGSRPADRLLRLAGGNDPAWGEQAGTYEHDGTRVLDTDELHRLAMADRDRDEDSEFTHGYGRGR